MSARHPWRLLTGAAIAILLTGGGCGSALAQDDPGTSEKATPEQLEFVQTLLDGLNKKAKDQDVFVLDYNVPNAPALTLLDVDISKINQSNSLKPFVLSVPSILGSKGEGQAISLDASMGWLAERRPENRTIERYTGTKPLWFRTRIGTAVYQGISDTDPAKQKPSRLAVGFSTSVLDSSDPLLARVRGQPLNEGKVESAWQRCLRGGLEEIRNGIKYPKDDPETVKIYKRQKDALQNFANLTAPGSGATPAQVEAAKKELVDSGALVDAADLKWEKEVAEPFVKSEGGKTVIGCNRVADRAARTGADFDLGGGAVWEGDPGKVSGLANPAAALWTAFRLPLAVGQPANYDTKTLIDWAEKTDSWFMVGGAGRVGFSELVPTGDGAKPKIRANTLTAWLGGEFNSDNDRITAQVGLRRTSPRATADSAFAGTQTVYLIGLDHKFNDSLWLTATYGWADATGALKSDSVVKVGIVLDSPGLRKAFGQ